MAVPVFKKARKQFYQALNVERELSLGPWHTSFSHGTEQVVNRPDLLVSDQ
jgi:hypothetical protein